jgi:predicted RNA binding protein YcfA (HicA-like mRNA interferase family)
MRYTIRPLDASTWAAFEQNGFTRVRQVGKHAWIVSKLIQPA